MDKRVCKVVSVHLGPESHGIFTCFLQLDFGGTIMSFGGYSLDTYHKERGRIGTAAGMDWLVRLIRGLGVDSLKSAVGKNYYALFESDCNHRVIGMQQLEPDGEGKFVVSEWEQFWFPKGE